MRKSEIFENYIKIAQEKGLVSGVTSEQAKKKLEENPRVDSLSVKDIEGLYNTKPESPKDMKYDRNIMEKAHPKSVIIAPSHDKLNGLVENNNERQDIIMHILHKSPGGQLQNRKYAEKELILNLVRLGNDLDNNNKEELRVLADTCLQQITKMAGVAEFTKKELVDAVKGTAGTAGAIGATRAAGSLLTNPYVLGAAGIAAVFGLIYLKQHTNFFKEGFSKDIKKLIAEVDDILESNTSWQTKFGFGYEYTENFLKMMIEFKQNLIKFQSIHENIKPVLEKIDLNTSDVKQIADVGKQLSPNGIEEAYKQVQEIFNELAPTLIIIKEKFADENYQLRQIQEKGTGIRLIDSLKVFHGGWGIVKTDFEDVSRASAPFIEDVQNISVTLSRAKSYEEVAKRRMDSAKDLLNKTTPNLTQPVATNSPTTSAPASTKEEDEDWVTKGRKGLESVFDYFSPTK